MANLELTEQPALRERSSTHSTGKRARVTKASARLRARKSSTVSLQQETTTPASSDEEGSNGEEETVVDSDEEARPASSPVVSVAALRITSRSPSPVAHRTRHAAAPPVGNGRPERAAKRAAVAKITVHDQENLVEMLVESLPDHLDHTSNTRRTSSVPSSSSTAKTTLSPSRRLRTAKSRPTLSPDRSPSVDGDIESGVDADLDDEDEDEDDDETMRDSTRKPARQRSLRNGKVIEPTPAHPDEDDAQDMSFELEQEEETDEPDESESISFHHAFWVADDDSPRRDSRLA